jgi:hypothetical protein
VVGTFTSKGHDCSQRPGARAHELAFTGYSENAATGDGLALQVPQVEQPDSNPVNPINTTTPLIPICFIDLYYFNSL